AALDPARQGDARGLDLPIRQPARLKRHQAVVAKGDRRPAPRLSAHPAALLLSVLDLLRHQHDFTAARLRPRPTPLTPPLPLRSPPSPPYSPLRSRGLARIRSRAWYREGAGFPPLSLSPSHPLPPAARRGWRYSSSRPTRGVRRSPL